MEKLLIATHNQGKLKELSSLLEGVPFELVSLADVGIEHDVDETGATLEVNAALKAETYSRLSGLPTLADDSGLEVDSLGGEPGVHSARYAGEGATDNDRIALLLSNLADKPQPWSAGFRCVVAIVWPGRPAELYPGECLGEIIIEPRGSNGFGYDPVFMIPQEDKTMAELTAAEKNRVSHRSAAVLKARDALMRRTV
ncbi:MAG: RdgB/HAM1 family non-canonical purine NTP pyrophosphatase [Chloroflexi bacterium]|nr:RdgB/HAM1 family non-canonical purine NTP pyrophosphatase [Chloroflexota bacterium]MDA1228871.1 RdgB/HAM1 family non-canonical purine NTP pyrophosphatase [Chloroflexota bacterium]